MDADQLIEGLKKQRTEKSVAAAIDWLEANPSHFQIEAVMEQVLATPRTPETVSRLLAFVNKNPKIASTSLAVLIKQCGRTNREVVAAAKVWLTDHPFEPGAGWLLRECLRLRSGKQFAKLALNWIGTQTDTAQVADLLATLVATEPNADVLMEARAWLARNWHSENPVSDVVVSLCKSRCDVASQLGFSYIERIYTSEVDFFARQDAVVGVLVWLFSKGTRVDAGEFLLCILNDTIQREEWTTVIDAALRKVKAPTKSAIEFAKRWLRAGRFESGDWVIVSMLLDLKPDQETIQIARDFLTRGLRIGQAEDAIRKRLSRLGA